MASNDIACNGGPNPTKSTTKILDVAAGSTVKAIWRHTLTSAGSDVVDPSHKVRRTDGRTKNVLRETWKFLDAAEKMFRDQ